MLMRMRGDARIAATCKTLATLGTIFSALPELPIFGNLQLWPIFRCFPAIFAPRVPA